MSCKPESHYIQLGTEHRIEVVTQGNAMRFIPQAWTATTQPPEKREVYGEWEAGGWVPLLPEGMVRLSVREATNDCRMHAGKEVVE